MIRDQLYNAIVNRLNGSLDYELFERCAASLLKAYHPSLVPVRGGSDAGKDGLISDNKGEAFPLVTTTSKDVIGNLTRNLKTYIAEDGPRRYAVLATSQKLTDRKRRNINDKASELGFTLVGIYDQAAFADLLYKDAKWRLELLNLTGEPPALSVLPLTKRPLIGDILIGRENDMAWLQDTTGDLLLSGQPGSGKTFIFHTLAKNGNGLFAVSNDREGIANCIREDSPKQIFVDDAHINIELITNLKQIRDEVRTDFNIVSNCWPGDKDKVQVALGISNHNTRELALLTRDQIIDVIKATGIYGPNHLLHELVTQANGKPGLAVTLCQLVKNNGIRDVTLGDALLADVCNAFESLIGKEAIPVLAAFSLGGDSGMEMQVVSGVLNIPIHKLHIIVTGLAAGGVLNELYTSRLSVIPRTLRYTLTRDVFLSGPASLPQEILDHLIAKSPSYSDTVRTLIGAEARGGNISEQKMISLVEQTSDKDVWLNYAWLGEKECVWVFETHPEMLPTITNPALVHVSEKVIPMLLSTAIDDQRELHSSPDHPLRKIKDWVESSEPGTEGAIQNRTSLLNAVLKWVSQTNNWQVALRALKIAFSPKFSFTESDPGIGMTITFNEGCLHLSELQQIMSFWPKVLEHIRHAEIVNWEALMEMIQNWAYPGQLAMGKGVPKDISQPMKAFARQMCNELAEIRPEHNGLLRKIKEIMRHCDYSIENRINPEFEILFPIESNDDDWEERGKQQFAAAEKLAEYWSGQAPEIITELLETYEQQAKSVGIDYPRLSPVVCHRLSKLVDKPLSWATICHKNDFYSDLISPFLIAALNQNQKETDQLLATCLFQDQYRYMAISIILSENNIDSVLVNKAIDMMDENTASMLRRNFRASPLLIDRVEKLLRHTNSIVAENAAYGEWNCDPRGKIRDSLKIIWENTILEHAGNHGSQLEIKRIFESNPTLACEWLAYRIENEPNYAWYMDYAAKEAFKIISDEQKKYLLSKLKDKYAHVSVALRLIGDNIDLYAHHLTLRIGKDLHLSPLKGRPTGKWIDMAILALNAGYSPEDIVHTAYVHSMSWTGKASDMWQGWFNQFDALCTHKDDRIKEIGEIGKKIAKHEINSEIIKEHNEEVYGIR